MNVVATAIPEVKLITPRVFSDNRGYFKETWNRQAFSDAGIDADFVQDNQSRSGARVIRGLHYQLKRPQGKLVRALSGGIYDVAVDLRRRSMTFGHWVGAHLTDRNHAMLWVPEGFAHGFCVTTEYAEIAYKCTDFYCPDDEHTIRWDDPDLKVEWPIAPGDAVSVSDKDGRGVAFKDAEYFP